MPRWLTPRLTFAALFLASAGLMAFGYYLQYVEGLEPCPLCMTQRVFIVTAGLAALAGALLASRPIARRVTGTLVLLLCLAGSGFSGRHVWLQSLPKDQAPACGPSVEYLLDALPVMEALEVLLRGDGNCAEISWTFLGLSIPAWTLLCFLGMGGVGIWAGWRRM
ncbi:MAG: disulfide bond formation protein B [Gammaproteobacteria bacterium]